jgi:hypothetical protein
MSLFFASDALADASNPTAAGNNSNSSSGESSGLPGYRKQDAPVRYVRRTMYACMHASSSFVLYIGVFRVN